MVQDFESKAFRTVSCETETKPKPALGPGNPGLDISRQKRKQATAEALQMTVQHTFISES